jgi:hypothetical protein
LVGAALGEPPLQKKPAEQLPDGAVSPDVSQKRPAVHAVHCAALDRPSVLEKVPAGQGEGVAVPCGQKEPAGHVPPVGPLLGLRDCAAPLQKKPGSHWPEGADKPCEEQKEPGVQGSHCELLRLLSAAEKVPTGHGCGVAVPLGQKLPAGQLAKDVADEFWQKKPSGHVLHADWPLSALYVPGAHGEGAEAPASVKAPGGVSCCVGVDAPPGQ